MEQADVERVARALCEVHIRKVRKWDTEPAELEAMLPAGVDYSWTDHIPEAEAAIAAMTVNQGEAEILREAEQVLHADITQDVAPDLGRAIERLEMFCASQNAPTRYKDFGPGLYYSDVRAVLAALNHAAQGGKG